MKILYIGHYNEGSTSRMRGEQLRSLLPAAEFTSVNIDIPMLNTPRLIRSMGWRYKIGPLIKKINAYLERETGNVSGCDLIWVDKGVFIQPDLIRQFRNKTPLLVHFTPDPAFTYHRSKLFFNSLSLYDYCVTTKSYELDEYRKFDTNTILATQGYDRKIHKSSHRFEEKNGVAFIGHREEDREEVIAKILEVKVPVALAGIYWQKFAFKHRNNKYLSYAGNGVFGPDYARMISKAQFGLGFLSKIVPERHTTRTFEIPACGTALITEDNSEIRSFYNENEVIYFNHPNEIVEKIQFGLTHKEWLRNISKNGFEKVKCLGVEYESILERVLMQIKPLSAKLKCSNVTASL